MAASTGRRFVVLRPTLADVVLKMPRGAQVIYPKDLGAILIAADIGPGMRVLEAGVGSGALSMALLRAGAEVVGYEVRADFAAGRAANVAAWAGPGATYRVEERDMYEGIDERDLDRVVLDLPEPWRALGPAAEALRPGGILLSYLPSITQVATLRADHGVEALRHGRDLRGAAAHLARRGALGPPRPPHGGPHRIHHDGKAARPTRGRRRPRSEPAERDAARSGRASPATSPRLGEISPAR